MKIERELMRGAAPLAVLKLLEDREMYGYEIVQALAKNGDGVLSLGQSTLYPMLYNLQAKGLVAARLEKTPAGRQRRYYRLTTKGKRRLARDTAQWKALVRAMAGLGIADAPRPATPAVGGAS